MSTSARSEIFSRLRGVNQANSAAALRERSLIGSAPAAPLPAAQPGVAFLCNVLNNGGTIDCAENRSGAVKSVANYLYEHFRSQRLVAGNDPRLAALPWRDAGLLPRFGATEGEDAATLSYAQLGVAETGAIVTFTGKANPATNNFLPEHHIALVAVEDVVTTLEMAWSRINAVLGDDNRPRGINFIAGPSSTADIGAQLVAGAHGPRHWHVILVGDMPQDTLAAATALAVG